MTTRSQKNRFVLREIKYPLFLLGLVIMIIGGLTVQHLALPLAAEVATEVVGFVLLFLGIILE